MPPANFSLDFNFICIRYSAVAPCCSRGPQLARSPWPSGWAPSAPWRPGRPAAAPAPGRGGAGRRTRPTAPLHVTRDTWYDNTVAEAAWHLGPCPGCIGGAGRGGWAGRSRGTTCPGSGCQTARCHVSTRVPCIAHTWSELQTKVPEDYAKISQSWRRTLQGPSPG